MRIPVQPSCFLFCNVLSEGPLHLLDQNLYTIEDVDALTQLLHVVECSVSTYQLAIGRVDVSTLGHLLQGVADTIISCCVWFEATG